MGRIASTFKRLSKVNEIALATYVTVGRPSLLVTRQLVPVMARQGADLIELGLLPGDHKENNESKTTLEDCFSVTSEARRANEIPLIIRCGYALIQEYGLDRFGAEAAALGVDGLIAPNLPLEEAAALKAACETAGVDLIMQVSTSTSDEHLRQVTQTASGFVYCVTGTHNAEADEALKLVERVREYTDLPLIVQGNITNPQQIAQITRFAEGASITDAVTNLIETLPEDEIILGVAELVREAKEATIKK